MDSNADSRPSKDIFSFLDKSQKLANAELQDFNFILILWEIYLQ